MFLLVLSAFDWERSNKDRLEDECEIDDTTERHFELRFLHAFTFSIFEYCVNKSRYPQEPTRDRLWKKTQGHLPQAMMMSQISQSGRLKG